MTRIRRRRCDLSRTPAGAVTSVDTPAQALKISISQNYPSAPATVTIVVPIVRDDLDLAHAQMPPHLHMADERSARTLRHTATVEER